jgi:hypothetical protein
MFLLPSDTQLLYLSWSWVLLALKGSEGWFPVAVPPFFPFPDMTIMMLPTPIARNPPVYSMYSPVTSKQRSPLELRIRQVQENDLASY